MSEFDPKRTAEDHARSISALTQNMGDLNVRVTYLERMYRDKLVLEARTEERAKADAEATKLWRATVETKVNAMYGAVSKLVWIVLGSVVTAFVAWVFSLWNAVP